LARELTESARRLVALDELAQMRAAASWLTAWPQLGSEVFPRGRRDHTPSPQAALYVAFLGATLVMLEGRDGQGSEAPSVYGLAVSDLWRTPDAIARVRRLLAADGAARPLAGFPPEIPPMPATSPCVAGQRSPARSWLGWSWRGLGRWPSTGMKPSGRFCSAPLLLHCLSRSLFQRWQVSAG
jgi:hypothetical protein